MPSPLSGPGLGLPLPQYLYPSELQNAPLDAPSNRVGLAPGDALPVPAGNWYISLGMYCVLQYLDPVTGMWAMGATAAWAGGISYIKSDGFNYRIANLTGCPVSGSITGQGSNYVQATTTISVAGGNSTWQPIVGGALALNGTISPSVCGGGYGVAPQVFIPPPPPAANNPNGVGGVQATGYVTISGGTVNGFTFTNPGAGYPTPPNAVVVPNPTDPNLSVGITAATITFTLTQSGSLTGVFCTNPGAPITPANITLTVAGAGTNATVVPNVMQTVTAATVSTAGVGYAASATNAAITTGGAPNPGSISSNPESLYLAFRPRPAQIGFAGGAGGSITVATAGVIYDGGLFLSAPTLVIPAQGIVSTVAALAVTMGSRQDYCHLQPAP